MEERGQRALVVVVVVMVMRMMNKVEECRHPGNVSLKVTDDDSYVNKLLDREVMAWALRSHLFSDQLKRGEGEITNFPCFACF